MRPTLDRFVGVKILRFSRTKRDGKPGAAAPWWRVLPVVALAVPLASCAQLMSEPESSAEPLPPRAEQESAAPAAANETPAAVSTSPLGSYLAGRYAYTTRDISSAAEYMSRALAEDSDNQSLLRRTLTLMIADGRFDQARDLARQLIALDPESMLGHLLLLVEDAKAGDFDAAKERLVEIPREGVYALLLPMIEGWIEMGRGDSAAAIEVLQPLASRSVFGPYFDFHAGLLFDLVEQPASAEEHYGKAVKAVPGGTLRTVAAYGAFLERAGRLDDARALYQAYLEQNPDTLWLEGILARIEEGRKPERAVPTAQAGLAEAFFGAASALPQDNGGDAGLLYARLAIYLRPDFWEAQILIGEILDSLSRHEEAFAIYRQVDARSPFSWTARLRAATNLAALDRVEEAEQALRNMMAERPDRADAAITLGDTLRMRESYAGAAEAYGIAIGRTPEMEARHWSLLYARGVTFERTDRWPLAEADFLAALELQPEQPLVLNYLGYSWIEKGMNLQRAKEMIEQAVALRPNDGYIVDSLGWALYRLGEYEEAVDRLEHSVELLSSDPIINDHLGDAYWRVGRRMEAKFQWHRSLELGPDVELAAIIRRKLVKGLTAEALPEGTP